MESFKKTYFGLNREKPWKYSESLDKIVIPPRLARYRGYLSWKDSLIGNVELQSVKRDSDKNLDSNHHWFSLSDFHVQPCFRDQGFGKLMLRMVKDFSDIDMSGIVKRVRKVKQSQKYEQMVANFMDFLSTQGFKQFDDETFYYMAGGETVR